MKTTLVVDGVLMRRLRALAAERGTTLSAVVEDFLRRSLAEARRRSESPRGAPALPSYPMGAPLADVADRAALEYALERPEGRKGRNRR